MGEKIFTFPEAKQKASVVPAVTDGSNVIRLTRLPGTWLAQRAIRRQHGRIRIEPRESQRKASIGIT